MATKITKTVKDARLKWIKALESGRYKQIKGRLCEKVTPNSYGYCCLGVLCKVNPDRGKFLPMSCAFIPTEGGLYNEEYAPPVNVSKAVGLTKKTIDKCIDMNDGEYKSFKEIATYLRKIWKIE